MGQTLILVKRAPGVRPLLLAVLLLVLPHLVKAQGASIFPLGEKAPNVHHTGDVWLSHLHAADSLFRYNLAVAKFAPGAKLNWHVHPKGQQLLILEGEGLYQEKGKPVQVVRQGDIVSCSPTTSHWHAATPASGVTYLAITGNQRTVWQETVTEEYFRSFNVDSIRQVQVEQEVRKLSLDKWDWMADKDVAALEHLFAPDAKFVHMGGTWSSERELEIIEEGSIHYKKTEVHEVSVTIHDNTAILLNRITLLAVVGGREVTNPFMVTEVYQRDAGHWKLASLSFTKLLGEH